MRASAVVEMNPHFKKLEKEQQIYPPPKKRKVEGTKKEKRSIEEKTDVD